MKPIFYLPLAITLSCVNIINAQQAKAITNVNLDGKNGAVTIKPVQQVNPSPLRTYKSQTNNETSFSTAAAKAYNEFKQKAAIMPTLTAPVTKVQVAPAPAILTNNLIKSVVETVDTLRGFSDEMPSLLTPLPKPYQQPKPQKVVESLPPQLINAVNNVKQTVNNSLDKTGKMPELAPINASEIVNNQLQKAKNEVVMPELAPIALEAKSSTNANSSSNLSMPELSPINANHHQVDNRVKSDKVGFTVPVGTVLQAQKGTSYVVQPLPSSQQKQSIQEDGVNNNNSSVSMYPYRPSAGGGFSMPELASIETKAATSKSFSMPALAPLPTTTQAASSPNTNNTIKVWQQVPLQQVQKKNTIVIHHCISCSYCTGKKRKWYPAKKKVAYKMPSQQPKTIIKYVDRPSQTIVYVPQNKQQGVVQSLPQASQSQNITQQEPAQNVEQESQVQNQEKVLYRDYTNSYKKPETTTHINNNNCNCPNNTQVAAPSTNYSAPISTTSNASNQPIPVAKHGTQYYYNPQKYVGLNAGPTSGDYPVDPSLGTYNQNLRYAFYVNKKGKYSVAVYNDIANILVSQNGRVIETKFTDPKYGALVGKNNYFGSPENVAGIPIEYNYNRSVHKIGNVEFTYDFEGFIKSIAGSSVLYNSSSNLQQVDNVYVSYSGSTVVGVTPSNSNLIIFTGE